MRFSKEKKGRGFGVLEDTILQNNSKNGKFDKNIIAMTTVADKIALLPKNLQSEVGDFVDFLIQKYQLQLEEGSDSLTEDQKELLQYRHQRLVQNPNQGIDWEEARAKLTKKYV